MLAVPFVRGDKVELGASCSKFAGTRASPDRTWTNRIRTFVNAKQQAMMSGVALGVWLSLLNCFRNL